MVQTQTTLAGFLSPPTRPLESQSLSTPPPGQASPNRRAHSTPNAANPNKKKSKRALKHERKRKRKGAKLSRACKKNDSTENLSPPSSQITPMPSPSHSAEFDPMGNNKDRILITDQSLTDLLAATDVRIPANDSSTENNTLSESKDQLILRLESKLLATNIELQAEIDEKISLQNQVDVLMAEIDSLKKTDKSQKNGIKKLMNGNDKLRKDISRVSGIRRYAERNTNTLNSDQCDNSTQTEEICDMYDKYTVTKLVSITDSLLTALDDDNTGFTVVSVNKRSTSSHNQPPGGQSGVRPVSRSQQLPVNQIVTQAEQPHRPHPQPQTQPQPQPQPQPRSSVPHSGTLRPTPAPRRSKPLPQARQHSPSHQQSQPQSIPVVEIGAAARNAASTRYPTPVSSSNNSSETIIIGSSLISGLGPKLCSKGISATSFMYRGADIPTIQSRIRYILKADSNPKHIVLQVAGNDATKHESRTILTRYETLITDIISRCPNASVILCKVPPRSGTMKTISTINEINNHLDVFAQRFQNVSVVDVCPQSVYHFKKDGTHFNKHGLDHYACQLAGVLRNFYQVHSVNLA